MVEISKLIDALYDVLNDDATLSAYLGKKAGQTKIIKGDNVPELISQPVVQIIIMTNEMNTIVKHSEITFKINVYCQGYSDGSINHDEFNNILQRCEALIDDQDLTVSGNWVYVMYVEGMDSPIADREHDNTYLAGLRCRMSATKL